MPKWTDGRDGEAWGRGREPGWPSGPSPVGVTPLPGSRTSKAAQPEGGESCPEVSRWETVPPHPPRAGQTAERKCPTCLGLSEARRERGGAQTLWESGFCPREVSAGSNFTVSKEQALGSECRHLWSSRAGGGEEEARGWSQPAC